MTTPLHTGSVTQSMPSGNSFSGDSSMAPGRRSAHTACSPTTIHARGQLQITSLLPPGPFHVVRLQAASIIAVASSVIPAKNSVATFVAAHSCRRSSAQRFTPIGQKQRFIHHPTQGQYCPLTAQYFDPIVPGLKPLLSHCRPSGCSSSHRRDCDTAQGCEN